jgi:hypothetical protein
MRKGGLLIQTFDYAACKVELDRIDEVLAEAFGLTAEELDFIESFDIKYRMVIEDGQPAE